MNLIKKILNKKNRKFLIAAIAIVAIAFYFSFNKENFIIKAISSRLNQEEKRSIMASLYSIYKNTPKKQTVRRIKMHRMRGELNKPLMTFEGIKFVQKSFAELYRATPSSQQFQKNKIKNLMSKFDKVKLTEIEKGITSKEDREQIYKDLKNTYENIPEDKIERRKRLKFIMYKLRGFNTELTLQDHKEIISRLDHMIKYTPEEKKFQKNKLLRINNMIKNSLN